jgi:hypothetical protein
MFKINLFLIAFLILKYFYKEKILFLLISFTYLIKKIIFFSLINFSL